MCFENAYSVIGICMFIFVNEICSSSNCNESLIFTFGYDGTVRLDLETGFTSVFTDLHSKSVTVDEINQIAFMIHKDNEKIQRIIRKDYGLRDSDTYPLDITGIPRSVIYGLTSDPRNEKLYFTSWMAHQMVAVDYNGGAVRVIAEGLNYPMAVTIDVNTETLYFTERYYVSRMDTSGRNRQRLVQDEMQAIYALNLDLVNGKMYWATSVLKVANLDGTDVQEIDMAKSSYVHSGTIGNEDTLFLADRENIVRMNTSDNSFTIIALISKWTKGMAKLCYPSDLPAGNAPTFAIEVVGYSTLPTKPYPQPTTMQTMTPTLKKVSATMTSTSPDVSTVFPSLTSSFVTDSKNRPLSTTSPPENGRKPKDVFIPIVIATVGIVILVAITGSVFYFVNRRQNRSKTETSNNDFYDARIGPKNGEATCMTECEIPPESSGYGIPINDDEMPIHIDGYEKLINN